MTDQKNEELEKRTREIDLAKLNFLLQEVKDNQNLLFGTIGGAVAAAIGAAIWAIITALSNFQIGWMAVGVGFLVGYGVRICGKGIDKTFGGVGAVLSFLGCVVGNLLTACILISKYQHVALLQLLPRINPQVAVELLKVTFRPLDLLFYGIAVYEGYRFSFRRVSKEELEKLVK